MKFKIHFSNKLDKMLNLKFVNNINIHFLGSSNVYTVFRCSVGRGAESYDGKESLTLIKSFNTLWHKVWQTLERALDIPQYVLFLVGQGLGTYILEVVREVSVEVESSCIIAPLTTLTCSLLCHLKQSIS